MLKVHAGPRRLRPTYDESERQPYRCITPEPLSPTVGAEIGGVALSRPVDAETFERIVAAGAKQAGREVRVFERRGAASDHLLPPAFTEGQYLKVLLCYVY